MHMLLVGPLVAVLALLSGTATPEARFTFPLTPGPESCVVEPIHVAELVALAELDAQATPAEIPELSGDPVSDPVAAAVRQTIVTLFACQNAGEPLRAFALYTDAYRRQVVTGLDQALLTRMATPEPLDADERTTILAIDDIRVLADGRVYATVTLDPALIPVQKMFGFLLVDQDGQWLIDDVLDELEFSLP